MPKLAVHGHSYKKGGVGGIDRHNERIGERHSNEDIDSERTHLNMYFRKPEKTLYQECKKEVERVKANGGRLRSDQNWITEFITYAPKGLSNEEYERYFKVVHDFFAEKIGSQNIKLAVVHMDEATPHMHLDFMPLVRNEAGEPIKLSSKEVVTRNLLFSIHDELPKRLQEQGFDIQRGNKVTVEDKPLKGRSVKKYKADQELERLELEKKIENLKVQHELLEGKIREDYEVMDRNWMQIQAMEKDMAENGSNIDTLEAYLGRIVNELKRFDNIDKVIDNIEGKSQEILRKQVLDKKLEYGLAAKKVNADIQQAKSSYNSILERLEKAKAAATAKNINGSIKKPKSNNRDR